MEIEVKLNRSKTTLPFQKRFYEKKKKTKKPLI